MYQQILETLRDTRVILVDTIEQLAHRGVYLKRIEQSSVFIHEETQLLEEKSRRLNRHRLCTQWCVAGCALGCVFLFLIFASYAVMR
jgi:hypothetical protein